MKSPTHCEFAGRYRVITELESHAGRTTGWRAKDLAFGDDVAIYPLPGDLPADRERIAAFEAAFSRDSKLALPGAVRWHSLDLNVGVAVREWVNGFTLLDLLRQRRELTAMEVIALLHRLPDTLDWMSTHGAPPPVNLLPRTWVAFEPAISTEGLHLLPVSKWPPYQLKLGLLRPRDFWHAVGEDAADLTCTLDTQSFWRAMGGNRAELIHSLDAPSGANCLELACLIRELLGERVRSGPRRPMPRLNEKANELILDTLKGEAWKSGCEFWKAFATASAKESDNGYFKRSAEPFAFQIPTSCKAVPCRVVALDSDDKRRPPIRLCGGLEFQFGRAKSLVDFPTILSPETLEKNEVSGGISRKQARIEARDGALWLCDGHGGAPSSNGTKWNGAPLPAGRPIQISGRGVLKLANRYSLTLMPVIGEFAPKVTLEGEAVHSPPSTPPGAVIPMAIEGQRPVWRAVWVLTTLGFHLDAAGDIEWHESNCIPPAGIFIRARNGFWLANASLPAHAVRVGEAELRHGEAAPLLPGQGLRIGERIYDVSICN